MDRKLPVPVCKAFLACRGFYVDEKFGDFVIVGQAKYHAHHVFPSAVRIGFYARLTSGHGQYTVRVELHDESGEVVWRDGPPYPWPLPSPVDLYDVTLDLCPVFPRPGTYDFVLTADGVELDRQRFTVALAPAVAAR